MARSDVPWTQIGTASSGGYRGTVLWIEPNEGVELAPGQELHIGRPIDSDATILLNQENMAVGPTGVEIVVSTPLMVYQTPVFRRL